MRWLLMEINRNFEELYECAERHDTVGFNRALYWLLANGLNTDNVMTDIFFEFAESEYCLDCDNVQPTKLDQIIIDGEKIYLKVCQDCGVETEIE